MFRVIFGAGFILVFLSFLFFRIEGEFEDVPLSDIEQESEVASFIDEKKIVAKELKEVSIERLKNSVVESKKVEIKNEVNHTVSDEPNDPKMLTEEEEVDLKNFILRGNTSAFLPLVIKKLHEMNISKKKRNQVVEVFKDYHSFQEKSKDEFNKFLNKKYGGYDVTPSTDDWILFHNKTISRYKKKLNSILGERLASDITNRVPFPKKENDQLQLFEWKSL